MKFCNLSSVSCPHIRPPMSSPAMSSLAISAFPFGLAHATGGASSSPLYTLHNDGYTERRASQVLSTLFDRPPPSLVTRAKRPRVDDTLHTHRSSEFSKSRVFENQSFGQSSSKKYPSGGTRLSLQHSVRQVEGTYEASTGKNSLIRSSASTELRLA